MLHRNGIWVFSTFIVKHHAGSIALSRLLDKDLQGYFGRGSLGGGSFAVGEALSAIRKAGTTVALFAPGRTYRHFNGKHFETIDWRFFVDDGGDIEGSPMKPVSHFVSEKACGGSEFFFTNFNGGFGKGRWVDGVVCSTTRARSPISCRANINIFCMVEGPGYTMSAHRYAVNPSIQEPPDHG
ncbi:hypothetical protein HOY82DRAFT_609791 [Tuber indicum]|nr:hypothetical protein HOY82DRAFT_609791 [Tuber indicum]